MALSAPSSRAGKAGNLFIETRPDEITSKIVLELKWLDAGNKAQRAKVVETLVLLTF